MFRAGRGPRRKRLPKRLSGARPGTADRERRAVERSDFGTTGNVSTSGAPSRCRSRRPGPVSSLSPAEEDLRGARGPYSPRPFAPSCTPTAPRTQGPESKGYILPQRKHPETLATFDPHPLTPTVLSPVPTGLSGPRVSRGWTLGNWTRRRKVAATPARAAPSLPGPPTSAPAPPRPRPGTSGPAETSEARA